MDTDGRRSIVFVYMIAVEITGLLFTGVTGLQFDSNPSFVQFYENKTTPLGTLLFKLNAYVSDSNHVTIFTDDPVTKMYVNITEEREANRISANITLNKELDRELYESEMDLKFFLSDAIGNTVGKTVKLYILDVCDEAPQFDRPSYVLEIEETDPVGQKLVYSEIRATDRDNGLYAVIKYSMEPKTESEYWRAIYNETFKLDPMNGSLYLLKNLDYENNSFYQFTVHAK
ncbi:hypothetical protein ACJMK2_035241, partial [Sinanodonta woodiana]